jgi:hypothetical protein
MQAKQTNKGTIARLKELFKDLFQFSDAERTSFKERRTISPTTAATPYSWSPGLVIIDIALEETMLKSILIPPLMRQIYMTH